MQQSVVLALSAAVATSGTFTVGYPAGFDRGAFEGAPNHSFTIGNMGPYNNPDDFTIAFGATVATITYTGTTTLPAGVNGYFTFDIAGDGGDDDMAYEDGVREGHAVVLNLGSPDVADVNGVFEAQSGAAGAQTLDGALVVDGVAIMDVARNLVADSGGADTAVLTITGTDIHGNAMVENITLNGTTAVAGKKAFKTVTGVVSSATTSNGAFLGTGDVLGLPVFLPGTGHIVAEIEDGAAATAGTAVAGLSVNTPSTATTADTRGTYVPNSTPDAAKTFEVVCVLPDPTFQGNAQFAG